MTQRIIYYATGYFSIDDTIIANKNIVNHFLLLFSIFLKNKIKKSLFYIKQANKNQYKKYIYSKIYDYKKNIFYFTKEKIDFFFKNILQNNTFIALHKNNLFYFNLFIP